MALRIDKNTGDLVIFGWEDGIKQSPHKGIANMQAVNISTETGEVMTGYIRSLQSQAGDTSTNHTINAVDTSHLSTSFALLNGVWINISASTISGLSTGNYFIQNSNGTASGGAATSFQVSAFYKGALTTGMGSTGTATFTLVRAMSRPVARAREMYLSSGTAAYRYYVLDSQGLVWVQDSGDGSYWALPDFSISYYSPETAPSGMCVYNGWLQVFSGHTIWCKPTCTLASTGSTTTTWSSFASGVMMSPLTTPNPHYAFVGHQGACLYTDGNFIGKIFANTSLLTGIANIQSYASYTAVTTTGTLSLIGGSVPYNGTDNTVRIPAGFFPGAGGTIPSALSTGTVYYIKWLASGSTFEVYAAASGGSALDIATGAVGPQFFNTYYPVSSSGKSTITFTPQKLNLPFFETAQCIGEINSTVLIGGSTNSLYPWNQVDPTPDNVIPTPEANITAIESVNNVAYFLAGNKGNIYVSNGSIATLVTSIPDYTAGVPGNPASYVEPYFTWGDIMFLRGRVYVSILDQTASKAGNCGGIWSFIPTQNAFVEEDVGIALRLENQSSYGTYSGYCPVLIAAFVQAAKSPQYYSAWESAISAATFGIDFTGTTSGQSAVIETDLIPIGSYIQPGNYTNVQSCYAAALVAGEAVTIRYRTEITAAWSSFTDSTSGVDNTAGSVGFRWPSPWANALQVQFQITLTPITSSGSSDSFVRLKELRLTK